MMAFKLEQVDQRSIDTVFGYIRSKQLDAMNIPRDIKLICLQYYYNPEYFAQARSDCFTISDDGMTVTAIQACEFPNHSIFGNKWIESMSNVIVTWTLRVDKLGNHMYFGLVSKYIDIHRDFGVNEEHAMPNYAISNNAIDYRYDNQQENHFDKYQERTLFHDFDYGQGATIIFVLNCVKATLSLKINDESEFVVFRDVEKANDIRYKMAVQIRSCGDQLTLLKYQETHL